jgi:hypothetical protein
MQPRVAVDQRERGHAEVATHQTRHHLTPGCRALFARESHVQDDALPVRLHAKRHQHRHHYAAFADAHLGEPAVLKQVANLVGGQVAFAPRCEIIRKTTHQPRDRVLRHGRIPKQWGERASNPPRVRTREVETQDRLIHAGRTPLVTRDRRAPPFTGPTLAAVQARPRHLDRRRSQARGHRPRPRPVTVPLPSFHARRDARTQGRLQLLVHDRLDHLADLLANPALDAVRTKLSAHANVLAAMLCHGVILRHPPPSGCSDRLENCAG